MIPDIFSKEASCPAGLVTCMLTVLLMSSLNLSLDCRLKSTSFLLLRISSSIIFSSNFPGATFSANVVSNGSRSSISSSSNSLVFLLKQNIIY